MAPGCGDCSTFQNPEDHDPGDEEDRVKRERGSGDSWVLGSYCTQYCIVYNVYSEDKEVLTFRGIERVRKE